MQIIDAEKRQYQTVEISAEAQMVQDLAPKMQNLPQSQPSINLDQLGQQPEAVAANLNVGNADWDTVYNQFSADAPNEQHD
jgi:hypothetical protein